MTRMPRQRLGVVPSLFIFTASCITICYVSLKLHYELPTPLVELINPISGLPQISEFAILEKAQHLSETIGYRTVGTREHAVADRWLMDEVNALKYECERIVSESARIRPLECEVYRQEGNGTHRFDMMEKRVYKNYVNLSNIVFRISNGSAAGKEHALLVNAHLDSTLPSPGAADDAVPTAMMLDAVRVLINTPSWTPQHAIIFLWNNAEESLQDGSHLFSTQGKWADTARAVINLEAAGTSGPELLFQATSEELIEAYSHVPRPYGTVLANDVFSSGIILSDTDFRQFQEYRNLTGLDMAIVGDSYLYHTRKDIVKNVQPGVSQHMGENVLALLVYLSSEASPLPRLESYSPPKTAYISILGRYFVMWSYRTGAQVYNAMFLVSMFLAYSLSPFAPNRRQVNTAAVASVLGGLFGAIVFSNIVALIMTRGLNKGMSWFAVEWYSIVLFGLPAMTGILTIQYLLGARLTPLALPHLEYTTFTSVHIFFSAAAVILQFLGVGSGAVGFIWALSSFVALLLQSAISIGETPGDLRLIVYVVAQVTPCIFGAEVAAALLDIFVPLTGRIGEEAPGEHIVATIVAVIVFLTIPFSIPLAHRFSRRVLLAFILILTILSAVSIGVFSSNRIVAFDELHPRRLFVLHTEDIVTGEFALHVSVADGAPGLPDLVQEIAQIFGSETKSSELEPIKMDDWNPDWNVLYPFSQFLTPYKIALDPPHSYVSSWASSFRVYASSDVFDVAEGTRTLTIVIDHPEIIWTVIGFDAHVLSWTLDDHPVPEFTRHHVKEASFYGVDQWTLDLVINATTPGVKPPLDIHFQGIQEKGMWPGKKLERDGPAMDLFEKFDAWIEERPGYVFDTMMLGCISGFVSI